MGLNFYDYEDLQPKTFPPNISAGSVRNPPHKNGAKMYKMLCKVLPGLCRIRKMEQKCTFKCNPRNVGGPHFDS